MPRPYVNCEPSERDCCVPHIAEPGTAPSIVDGWQKSMVPTLGSLSVVPWSRYVCVDGRMSAPALMAILKRRE